VLGINGAERSEMRHLDDGSLCRHAHQRIKVPRRLVVGEVALRIAALGLQSALLRVTPSVEFRDLPAQKEGNVGVADADEFGERSVRYEFKLDRACNIRLGEWVTGRGGARSQTCTSSELASSSAQRAFGRKECRWLVCRRFEAIGSPETKVSDGS
jgi:hypothetical protein